MKLRLTFRFLVLSVFAAGAFSVLSVQDAKADGWFCHTDWDYRNAVCNTAAQICIAACDPCGVGQADACQAKLNACYAGNDAKQQSCYSADAWQSFLLQVDLNIGDNFRILDEPDPICGSYPDMLFDCGNLETAEEIEACSMMIQQEQARYHCP
jgi:hypothetical protein